MGNPAIVWFRRDLRLADNPALRAAVENGGPIVPVYIHAPEEEGEWPSGGASRWWLHQSLRNLGTELQRRGSRLIVRRGRSAEVLRQLRDELGAQAVFWNRLYEPAAVRRDEKIEKVMRAEGLEVGSFNAGLLREPREIGKGDGAPYRVFTPFWKACLAAGPPQAPSPPPRVLPAPDGWPPSESLSALALEPEVDWAGGLRENWEPGQVGARKRLAAFFYRALEEYRDGRDRPDLEYISRLSPHLHFGEISPRQVWDALMERKSAEPFLRQLGWREFAHHLLYHFPHTANEPLRPEFADFPWLEDEDSLKIWQRGETGYPLVDAGMRQLWETGWMHNRVRMVVASFLVKDLLISWRQGARWFWDTLVDADLANNSLGWQWTAGCGADAAPFFRIFNPVTQGAKYDPNGAYVRRWVPELKGLSDRWIHRPWQAPADLLAAAGVRLGKTYPEPIVDHGFARQRALEGLGRIKKYR